MKLITLLLCSLTGCGVNTMDTNEPSKQPTVDCRQSMECLAELNPRFCTELKIDGKMKSTWDNGGYWLDGNCDTTNGDY